MLYTRILPLCYLVINMTLKQWAVVNVLIISKHNICTLKNSLFFAVALSYTTILPANPAIVLATLTTRLLLWLRMNSQYIFIWFTQLPMMAPTGCSGLPSASFSCSRNSRWNDNRVSLWVRDRERACLLSS